MVSSAVFNGETLTRNRVVADRKSVVKSPKAAAGQRSLDASDKLIQKLHRHKMQLGRRYDNTDFIIVHSNGKPIYPEYIRQLLTKLQKKADLPAASTI